MPNAESKATQAEEELRLSHQITSETFVKITQEDLNQS